MSIHKLTFLTFFVQCSCYVALGVGILFGIAADVVSASSTKSFRGTFLYPICGEKQGRNCFEESEGLPIFAKYSYSVCDRTEDTIGIVQYDGKCYLVAYFYENRAFGRVMHRRTQFTDVIKVEHWDHRKNRAGVTSIPALYFRWFVSLLQSSRYYFFGTVILVGLFYWLTGRGDRLQTGLEYYERSEMDKSLSILVVVGYIACAFSGAIVADQNIEFEKINAALERQRLNARYFYPISRSVNVEFGDLYTFSKVFSIPAFVIFHIVVPYWVWRRRESFLAGFFDIFVPSRRHRLRRVGPKEALPVIRQLRPLRAAHGVLGQIAVWNEARKNREIAGKLKEDERWLRTEQEVLEAARRRETVRAAVEIIEDKEMRRAVLARMGIEEEPEQR